MIFMSVIASVIDFGMNAPVMISIKNSFIWLKISHNTCGFLRFSIDTSTPNPAAEDNNT